MIIEIVLENSQNKNQQLALHHAVSGGFKNSNTDWYCTVSFFLSEVVLYHSDIRQHFDCVGDFLEAISSYLLPAYLHQG